MTETPIVGVAGCGATGARVVTRLLEAGSRIAVFDPDVQAVGEIVRRARRGGVAVLDDLGDLATCDLAVLCGPSPHAGIAAELVAAGVDVVSMGDDLDDVCELLALDTAAREHGVTVVVGAAMAPGLSGLLARSLVPSLDMLDELHVATHGTAGPSCARQHHRALGRAALGWHDGEWVRQPGGSGRDLVWFPEPVAAWDCYRAELPDPLLLRRAFPSAQRISARMSANRRDRLTSWLPMLTPPHREGGLSAVRVEARGGGADGSRVTLVSGVAGQAADLASAVCAAAALRLLAIDAPIGAHGTADSALDELDLLHHVTRLGLRVQEFTGVARATHW